MLNPDLAIVEPAAIITPAILPLTGAPRPPIRMEDANPRTHLRTIRRAVLTILFFLVLSICYVAQELIIPVILALLLSLLLSPVVTLLQRAHLPRAVGSILVLVAAVSAVAGGVSLLAQPARLWVANAPATVQSLQQRFRSFREPIEKAEAATAKLESLTQSTDRSRVVSTANEPSKEHGDRYSTRAGGDHGGTAVGVFLPLIGKRVSPAYGRCGSRFDREEGRRLDRARRSDGDVTLSPNDQHHQSRARCSHCADHGVARRAGSTSVGVRSPPYLILSPTWGRR